MILASCNSKKEVVNTKEDSTQIEIDLIKQGFIPAIVKHDKNSECEYILVNINSGVKFDPINFKDEKFKTFQVNGKEVYVKYRLLRRANRCKDVQPIEVEDIRNI